MIIWAWEGLKLHPLQVRISLLTAIFTALSNRKCCTDLMAHETRIYTLRIKFSCAEFQLRDSHRFWHAKQQRCTLYSTAVVTTLQFINVDHFSWFAYPTSAYRMSTAGFTIFDLYNVFLDVGHLLKHRLRKLWQEIEDSPYRAALNWATKSTR
jgi:hypothetical protein